MRLWSKKQNQTKKIFIVYFNHKEKENKINEISGPETCNFGHWVRGWEWSCLLLKYLFACVPHVPKKDYAMVLTAPSKTEICKSGI